MNARSSQTLRSLFSTEARKESALCSLQFIGSVLVVIGFFGPWIAHTTAALTVTGYELSEFTKFFPQVQAGTVPVRRALFVTPLLAGALSLILVTHRSERSPALQIAATALTALLGLAVLPPLQSLLALQYRMQLGLVVGAELLILPMLLARQLSERVRGILMLGISLAGAVPALWQALLLHPLVAEIYQAPILPGWGFIVCTVGFLALVVAGLRSVLTS